jgi:hypothetical protein
VADRTASRMIGLSSATTPSITALSPSRSRPKAHLIAHAIFGALCGLEQRLHGGRVLKLGQRRGALRRKQIEDSLQSKLARATRLGGHLCAWTSMAALRLVLRTRTAAHLTRST